MAFDLRTPEGLIAAAKHLDENPGPKTDHWDRELTEFLSQVAAANEATRETLQFHERLWNQNPVSGVGQGNISVDQVIGKSEFRGWVAARSLEVLPPDPQARLESITKFYTDLIGAFAKSAPKIPHLKIFRVLAAFYPHDLTCVAHRGAVARLVRRMGVAAPGNPVACHTWVRNRLNEVLGPTEDTPAANSKRMALAWRLYALTEGEGQGEEKIVDAKEKAGEEVLVPLPAARRRRGLTALAGGFPATLGILQEVKDGLTREEFLDYLRGQHPNLKEVSRRMIINILRSELGLIKNVNNEYLLTERGSAVLETSSPEELGDWLMTRVLGVDHVVKRLQSSAAKRTEVIALLQRVNPGWSSEFAPAAMINWLVSMDAIARNSDGVLSLTSLGQEWAEKIHWTPEFLSKPSPDDETESPAPEVVKSALALPQLKSIVSNVGNWGAFPSSLIEQLHLGLWGSARRHFAVLAGISGSGKTLLAQRYAEALGSAIPDGQRRYMIQAIQPGWYDPSPLLGYLNPLQKDTYQRTAFLSFLLRASQDPFKPFVVILDEMNLSHPEQYFAPLLSAMESGSEIQLHSEGDVFDGIPESIPYPANLAIIGTINMDETTHGLSDKVLDRAFTLEFWDIDLDRYPRWDKTKLSEAQVQRLKQVLRALMAALSPSRLHFGWRVVDDTVDFLAAGPAFGAASSFDELLDAVIYAKVLPKIRGESSDRLRDALEKTRAATDTFGLKRCTHRLDELSAELSRAGSVAFWR